MTTHFVIIGNGAAGYRAAKALHRADADAQISVFSDERYPFYLRRQLGDYLSGALSLEEVIFQSRNAYRRERIDLFLMTRITGLDPGEHRVTFASGPPVHYDRLLLATGTRAVPPPIPGRDLPGVATFDTLTEASALRASLRAVEQAVILGEGVIGLSLAECLVARGVGVTHLMAGDRFWPEMLDETASRRVETLLEDQGVRLLRGAAPRRITATAGRCGGVEIADGRTLPADLVACGCRREGAVDLAEAAGLDVGLGVRIDDTYRTSRPDIWAAGDAAEPTSGPLSGEAAVFCWQRAWVQGERAAEAMLGRPTEPPREAVRLRTSLFGYDVAVLGQGHLPAGGEVEAEGRHEPPDVYRRLVYRGGRLVGAIVLGTGETVAELNALVAEGAGRGEVETALALPAPADADADRVTSTFARHCPICAAELVVHRGTAAGARLRCQACNTDLVVRWDGRRGWVEILEP